MARNEAVIIALFITLGLASVHFSASYVLKGSVSCMDCNSHHDISGIMVSVMCGQEKKMATAITEEDGNFETTLVSEPPVSFRCGAKILGGTQQLYVQMKTSESKIVKTPRGHLTISKPLKFYTKCPNMKCGYSADLGLGSSKTIDLPVPKEWGLAPTSYYLPFVPIIGIP